jgi:ABC-type transport system substrate-binding protein
MANETTKKIIILMLMIQFSALMFTSTVQNSLAISVPNTTEPVVSREDTLILSSSDRIVGDPTLRWNPFLPSYAAMGGNFMIEKLMYQNPETGEWIPWLATGWEYNANFTELTIHLREGVTWSDGFSFTADDLEYTYWVYTKSFLMELQNVDIYDLIDIIDTNFQRTSYIRDDMLYPAPYADIWDTPLEKSLQDIKKVRTDSVCFPVTKQTFYGSDVPPEFKKIRPQNITVIYSITGAPIGLNNHIQLKDAKYYIDETGYPSNFKFYTGYQHKYPSRWKEFKDIFSWRRINGLW